MNFDKIISLGYPQFTADPKLYYTYLKNAHPRYRAEIRDLYFSSPYKYRYNGKDCMYGDVMGASSSEDHFEYMMKIQNEFGIPISLTFNETYPNKELCYDPEVLGGFVRHIGKFYDMGVRSCTISHVHLMALGHLQKYFPEMQWKNTVNHIITKPQQVVDYYTLGYDVINLDRSLNRDLDALRAMQPLRKKYPNLVLSLLVTEGCMPHCPYKVEHDTMNKEAGWNYWEHHGNVSCKVWRNTETNELPRIGTDMVWADSQTFYEYAELVDYFKFSGRLGSLPNNVNAENEKFVWSNLTPVKGRRWKRDPWMLSEIEEEYYTTADCFQDIVENNLGPIAPNWQFGRSIDKDHDCRSTWDRLGSVNEGNVWTTGKGRALNHVLKNCKNECWDCHACERTFGVKDFDSLIEVERDVDALRGHSVHFKGIPVTTLL
jgi:hypothetical protein